MTISVQFLFDVGSPNAYLVHKVLPPIEQRTGVKFTYLPILLGGLFKLTNNRSPAEAFAGIANKQAYDKLEMRRFVERHGLHAFKMNPFFPVNTLKLMRGACAAQVLGQFDRYVDAVFKAMWEDQLKMDDDAIFFEVMTKAGLDAQRIVELSQEPAVKAKLLENTQYAYDHGAFGSPSFLVGDELFFGKDRLRDFEEEIGRQKQAGTA
ncbi:MAG TPA: 2-hydroxychromene-2-carboxylate isomerase [Noviherbaspirillum sp.]